MFRQVNEYGDQPERLPPNLSETIQTNPGLVARLAFGFDPADSLANLVGRYRYLLTGYSFSSSPSFSFLSLLFNDFSPLLTFASLISSTI